MFPITVRLLSIFLMISIGWFARHRRIISDDTTRQLSKLLTYFFYPALIFSSMTRNFSSHSLTSHWQLPVGAFMIMLLGFCIGLMTERLLVDPHSKKGHAFLFQCAINNYSFLPMPLALMFWGESSVANLIFSSLGPELAVWTLGVYALSGRQLRRESLKHLINPPLLTIAASLGFILLRDMLPTAVTSFFSNPFPSGIFESLNASLMLLGGATIPAAMIIAGSRMAGLRVHNLFSWIQVAVAGLRLVIIPAVAIGILALLPVHEDVRRILVLVAIMPAAVASVVLSELYRADSEFAAASVLITHLLSLATIPIWLFLVF